MPTVGFTVYWARLVHRKAIIRPTVAVDSLQAAAAPVAVRTYTGTSMSAVGSPSAVVLSFGAIACSARTECECGLIAQRGSSASEALRVLTEPTMYHTAAQLLRAVDRRRPRSTNKQTGHRSSCDTTECASTADLAIRMHATCNATPCRSDRASPVEQATPPRHPRRTALHRPAQRQRALRAAPNGAFRPCGAARTRVSTHPMARVVLLCLRRTIGCAAYESRDLFAHGTCAARCMRRATSACKMHE